MATQNFETLRARVQALGFELIADNEAEHERGYYLLETATRTIHADAPGMLDAVAEWCKEREESAELAAPPLLRVENQIARELDDINLAITQVDLHEQEGAADKLPKILELAKSLANQINELGNLEHSNRPDSDDNEDRANDKERAPSERLTGDECLALYEVDAILHTLLGLAMAPDGIANDGAKACHSLEYACRAQAQGFKNDAKRHANPVLRNNALELTTRYERLAERLARFRDVPG